MNLITFLISWVFKNSQVVFLKLPNISSFKKTTSQILYVCKIIKCGVFVCLCYINVSFSTLFTYVACFLLRINQKFVYKELVFFFSALLVNLSLVHISKLIFSECLCEENMIRTINKPDIRCLCMVSETLTTDGEMYIFTYSDAIFTSISLAISLSFQKAVFDYLFF